MEVHGALGLTRGAGGEAQQCHVVPSRLHGIELHGLAQRHAIQLGIMVGGAVEVDHLFQEATVLGARHQLIGNAAVAQRK